MAEHDEFTKGYLQALADLRAHVQQRHDELPEFRWWLMAIKMLGERERDTRTTKGNAP